MNITLIGTVYLVIVLLACTHKLSHCRPRFAFHHIFHNSRRPHNIPIAMSERFLISSTKGEVAVDAPIAKIVDDASIENLEDTIVAKSLVWQDNKEHHYILVLDIARRVNSKRVNEHFSDLRLTIADREMAELVTGEKIGTIGPMNKSTKNVTVLIDENLSLIDPPVAILVGCGRPGYSYLFPSVKLLAEHCQGRIVPLTDESVPPDSDCHRHPSSTKSLTVSSRGSSTKSDVSSIFENLSIKEDAVCHKKDDKDFDDYIFSPQLLRKVAISSDTVKLLAVLDAAKRGRFHVQYHFPPNYQLADHLNLPSKVGGKTALHLATWKGALENVRVLLNHGAALNQWSTNDGNYGKTAIFYAITQARDDVVLLLLAYGARVTVVNNKGQTPRSLATSHLQESTILAIEEAEKVQINAYFGHHSRNTGTTSTVDTATSTISNHSETDKRHAFLNFYTLEYRNPEETCFGDLDPRFTDEAIDLRASVKDDWLQLPRSLFPTSLTTNTRRSNQTHMFSQMFQQTFLTSSSSPLSPSNEDSSIPTIISPEVINLSGMIVSKRQSSQTLTFANLAPLHHSNFASLREVLYSWRSSTPTMNNSANDESSTSLNSSESGEFLDYYAVQLILGKTLRDTFGDSLLRELGKYLREGQRVVLTGDVRAISPAKRSVVVSLLPQTNPELINHANSSIDNNSKVHGSSRNESSAPRARYWDIDIAVHTIQIFSTTEVSRNQIVLSQDMKSMQEEAQQWAEKLRALRGHSQVFLDTEKTGIAGSSKKSKARIPRNSGYMGNDADEKVGIDVHDVYTAAEGEDEMENNQVDGSSSRKTRKISGKTAWLGSSSTGIGSNSSPSSSVPGESSSMTALSKRAQRKLQYEQSLLEQKTRSQALKNAILRGDVPFWSLDLATKLLAHPRPNEYLASFISENAGDPNKNIDTNHDPSVPEAGTSSSSERQQIRSPLLVHDEASLAIFAQEIRAWLTQTPVNKEGCAEDTDGNTAKFMKKTDTTSDSYQVEYNEMDEFMGYNEAENRTTWAPTRVYEYVVGMDCEWRPDGFYETTTIISAVDNENDAESGKPLTSNNNKRYATAINGEDNEMSGKHNGSSLLRPSFVETLQLATRHAVYVLDLPALYHQASLRMLVDDILALLFSPEKVWKIGYDCAQDFQRLAVSYPGIAAFQHVQSIVDLLPLSKWLYPDVVNRHNSGLSKLCFSLFQRTLNKEQQTSTWHLRPFSPQQLEYAGLDAAILLVAFNQMAYDYHLNPTNIASQSHKRRNNNAESTRSGAADGPRTRSFRNYIEMMGILYSVKFQVFHPESSALFPPSNNSNDNNNASILHRLQEILEIVDTRRKKLLGIQSQLTRHVAVLKYHRSNQEKEFLPMEKLIDMLLAPTAITPPLMSSTKSGSSSVVGSTRHPTFDTTQRTDHDHDNAHSDNDDVSAAPSSMTKKSKKASRRHHQRNNSHSSAADRGGYASDGNSDSTDSTMAAVLHHELRGIAIHDLLRREEEFHDDDSDNATIDQKAQNAVASSPVKIKLPTSRLQLTLPDAITQQAQSPPVPLTLHMPPVSPSSAANSNNLLSGTSANVASVPWLQSIGTYVGRSADDCLHMIYRTLYLAPPLSLAAAVVTCPPTPHTTAESTSSSSLSSSSQPKVERMGGYTILMQESVLMFINTIGDPNMSGTTNTANVSRKTTSTRQQSTSNISNDPALAENKSSSTNGVPYVNEFDEDGALFTFYFPKQDLFKLFGSSSPLLTGFSTSTKRNHERASSTSSSSNVTRVDKRIFHLFIRERRKPYLYCGTCYPVSITAPAANEDSRKSVHALIRVKFRLLYFQNGPQPLSLHEDYQRILLEHTVEVDKRHAPVATKSDSSKSVISTKGKSGDESPIVPANYSSSSSHGISNNHRAEADTARDTKITEEETDFPLELGDWSHSVKLSRHNSSHNGNPIAANQTSNHQVTVDDSHHSNHHGHSATTIQHAAAQVQKLPKK